MYEKISIWLNTLTIRDGIYFILTVIQVVFCIISYAPQIIQLFKTKKSEDISVPTYVLLTLSFVDYGAMLLMDQAEGNATIPIILLNFFELSLCLFTTILVIYYKKHGRKTEEVVEEKVEKNE